MSHEVETMAYFGSVPWHGLGERLAESELYDWDAAQRKAKIDWEVELVQLMTADTSVKVDRFAVRRKTDSKILGNVGPRYCVLQNKDAFKWFQPFLESREAALHTAGSLRDGSRIWVLVKLNRDPMEIARDDLVEKFILLSHSHDGSLAVRAGFTTVRVVCANTLAMAHGDGASQLIRIRHTESMHEALEEIRDVMNVANAKFEATAEQYRLLARKDINRSDLAKYIKRVLKVDEEKEKKTSTRTLNQINEITRLFETGKGNNLPSVRSTYWAAYNGVTEWLSHKRGKDVNKRLDSLWFGDGASVNRRALQLALEMAV